MSLDASRFSAEGWLGWARKEMAADATLLDHWEPWLLALFGEHLRAGFAPHQAELWNWVWSIQTGVRPRPFVAIWPRGGGKSSTAEMACVAVAARKVRRYGLYVCGTQSQADDHLQNVANMFESSALAVHMPGIGDRLLNKFGTSRGWRRNRIRTREFTLDALGLDSAARGAKLDQDRPDLIVLDDVDKATDTPDIVSRKLVNLTRDILPAGSSDICVMAVQNLIHADSIFSQIAGRAERSVEFLADRQVSGPIPAVENLAYEQQPDGQYRIVAGTPTWAGQSLATCEDQINTNGLTSFLRESQHEVEEREGGMYADIEWRYAAWESMPDLVRVVAWVDPAVTTTGDCQGICVDGLGSDNLIYRLWSWEKQSSPREALKIAIRKAIEFKASHVGVETDQGGETWESTYREASADIRAEGQTDYLPPFHFAKAGSGLGSKAHRQAQQHAAYERGQILHLPGTHRVIERGLKRFGVVKPFDVADASFYSWADLTGRLDVKTPMPPSLAMPRAAAGGWNDQARRR